MIRKNIYETPSIEILDLFENDVIITSGNGEIDGGWGDWLIDSGADNNGIEGNG